MDTLQTLVHALAQHGDKPALVALRKHDLEIWSFARLADLTQRLAAGLTAAGVQRGMRVVVMAPNWPEWIVACLALLAAAAVPVPVDNQLSDEDLRHVLDDSEARWAFLSTLLARRISAGNLKRDVSLVLLDAPDNDERSWRRFLAPTVHVLPAAKPEHLAVLFYTSGTTGAPKGVPLTHRNLTMNLEALLSLGLIHTTDRLLLPLPLHHVYPFTIGMLAPLALGVPLVLPTSLTGPQILRALQMGQVTGIIGVPRLYEALWAAIAARVRQRGRIAATLFHGALAVSVALRRRLGWSIGRWLFAPLHKQLSPHLRVVASGGAALDPALAWTLEGLGWQVASGYGLTETSPLLAFHPPGGGHLDSVGTPLPGVEIRISQPEQPGQYGEVLAKGPNVFAGYWRLPEKTRAALTADGYFRTGDVGYFDADGYLHLVGRASEMIVLSGGENVRPEIIEEVLARSAHIREAGVLAYEGRLAALIVPDTSALHPPDKAQVAEVIRREVEQLSRALPSHHQISEYALTPDPLPRTRLGKLRRYTLAERYQQAKRRGGPIAETGPLPLTQMSSDDRQLLEDETAQRVWEWLARRFPHVRLTPDTHVHLDLGVDSLAWLTLTLEIREYAGVEVDEEAIGRIETVRDLLREAAIADQVSERGAPPLEQLQRPDALLSAQQRHWLQPPGPFLRTLGTLLFGLNRVLMRHLFPLTIQGLEHLPPHGPCIIAPNHRSWLDPLVVAAALPPQYLPRTYWGGWTGILFTNLFMRFVSRATRVVPIDPQRGPLSSMAFGVAAVQQGYNLVWFPEGGISRTGKLQRFRPGLGFILLVQPVPVVPVWIAGTDRALPPDRWRVRRHPLRITFGKPVEREVLQRVGAGEQPPERIVAALRECVAALGKLDEPRPGGETTALQPPS
ncbi:MAG TPA: AMP-binding protein [Methylomirabilota bacterium]|jgi:long-chain acyl-CoA synthetase|nr:AMP-binding protein [Methylomirabilota bacterium]